MLVCGFRGWNCLQPSRISVIASRQPDQTGPDRATSSPPPPFTNWQTCWGGVTLDPDCVCARRVCTPCSCHMYVVLNQHVWNKTQENSADCFFVPTSGRNDCVMIFFSCFALMQPHYNSQKLKQEGKVLPHKDSQLCWWLYRNAKSFNLIIHST